MKIAALFVGRFKSYEKTYDSILTNVFGRHDVDVFFSHNAANTGYDLDDFVKRYNVKSFENIESHIPSFIHKYVHNHPAFQNNGTMCHMFFHLENGMRLIEEYANKTGINYDVVLYLRADMHFKSKVIFESPKKKMVYIPTMYDWNGVCDQMAYGTLKTMIKYASTYTNMHKYLRDDNAVCHPETLTLHNIRANKLNITRFEMDSELDSARRG